jgi:hypothetical protein
MSKMQLITKAVITMLGVSTAVGFIRDGNFLPRSGSDTHILLLVTGLFIFLAFLSAIIYWLIFRNGWLVRLITSEGEAISHTDQQRVLAIWLRLLLVFSGLQILATSSRAIRLLLYLSPVKIRAWIQGLIGGNYPQLSDVFSQTALTNLSNILALVLTVYLIIGAPHLVRWHVRRLSVTNNNIDL